jgi:hypothetical protein
MGFVCLGIHFVMLIIFVIDFFKNIIFSSKIKRYF